MPFRNYHGPGFFPLAWRGVTDWRGLKCVGSSTSQGHPPGISAPANGAPPPGQADGGWHGGPKACARADWRCSEPGLTCMLALLPLRPSLRLFSFVAECRRYLTSLWPLFCFLSFPFFSHLPSVASFCFGIFLMSFLADLTYLQSSSLAASSSRHFSSFAALPFRSLLDPASHYPVASRRPSVRHSPSIALAAFVSRANSTSPWPFHQRPHLLHDRVRGLALACSLRAAPHPSPPLASILLWIVLLLPPLSFVLRRRPCPRHRNLSTAPSSIMKFGKTYTEHIERQVQNRLSGCSYVEFKRLKKVLKRCPRHRSHCRPPHAHGPIPSASASATATGLGFDHSGSPNRPRHSHMLDPPARPSFREVSLSCPGCDSMFFGELMEEMEEVVGCFNTRAQELLQVHLASGFRKFLLHLTFSKLDRAAMIQQGRSLVSYAFLNATAVRKILKKYDKVHQSNNGGVFKRRLLALRGELLQSPWILELTALHLNLADSGALSSPLIEGFGEFSCDFESDSPTLSCTALEPAKLEFALNCSICLDTVFDPVALGCGHVFCNSCVCAAASVPAYEGPRAADSSAKCPLCRKVGVYHNAVRLKELATLVHNRCKTYWTERLRKERKEQLREAKMASERILREVMRA